MRTLWSSATVVGFAIFPLLLDAPWRRFRVIWHRSFSESVSWTFRSFWLDYPLPLSYSDWDDEKEKDAEIHVPKMKRNLRAWPFLEPFFRSQGYILYRQDSVIPYRYFPVPTQERVNPHNPPDDPYPFARKYYDMDGDCVFETSTTHVAPARTVDGHDVIIKLVNGANCPEHQALKRLNEPTTRADPRNHTIYLLDTLCFGDFVFVVMPRWDASLPSGCDTVGELLNLASVWLQGLAFMHERRVIHGDILPQNIGMNVVCKDVWKIKGAQRPGQVKYAYYDFGYSLVYPMDITMEDTRESRWLGWRLRGLPTLDDGEVYNPFKADVAFLAFVIQTYVRHIEYLIPALGPFFDSILKVDRDEWPLAQEMFDRFTTISQAVPQALRERPLLTSMWVGDGVVMLKDYKRVPMATLLDSS